MSGFSNFFANFSNKIKNVIYQVDDGYTFDKIGNIQIPEKLSETNGFILANTVPEIYFPIDFHADRASKLRYYIAKNGKEVKGTELIRFIDNPNPIYSFSDLIYQYIFSYLSDGNAIQYLGVPDTYKKVSINNIERIDNIHPNKLQVREYSRISDIDARSLNDFIHQAKYTQPIPYKELDITRLKINGIDATKRSNSAVFSLSPLSKASKSIDLLLAVYSARYNVYVNNGAAGYLAKKGTANNMNDFAMLDPTTRDSMLADINNRNGLTGNRNLWGISSTPIEFVKTIATIAELMPLEETFENAIKIASVFQISPELVPRKDNSTFDNKNTAERATWENATMSIVDTVTKNISTNIGLIDIGYEIKADYSTVSILKQNEIDIQDIIKKKLDNLKLLKDIYPEKIEDINKEIDKILVSYGN